MAAAGRGRRGRSRGSRRSRCRSASRCGRPIASRFATLVADPSVTDPELEPVKPGMYTTAQPFMDLYLVAGRRLVEEPHGAASPIRSANPAWSPDGSALFFRAVNNKTYDETIYRYTVADRALEPVARGPGIVRRGCSRRPPACLAVDRSRDAARPISGCSAPAGSARASPTLNPQLARFTFSKPELFYFDNADGDRLGALLYKPAGLAPGDKVPVITWVYEKMTPAHPPLQRARSDVHQPRLRDADAEREGEGRADRRLVREVRRPGGERGARRWASRTASSACGATASARMRRRT